MLGVVTHTHILYIGVKLFQNRGSSCSSHSCHSCSGIYDFYLQKKVPLAIWHSYWKWNMYIEFPIKKWWFSIVMLVYQGVCSWSIAMLYPWTCTSFPSYLMKSHCSLGESPFLWRFNVPQISTKQGHQLQGCGYHLPFGNQELQQAIPWKWRFWWERTSINFQAIWG